jgi:UDP-N-acetylmuramyl pentapeptide phosphotransferase/UDP-N-acetylglucosamine-1-phosphate transferase
MSWELLILTAVILTGGELVYFYLARKYGILDHPNTRSMHEKPTIRGGGVVFYLAAAVFFLLSWIRNGNVPALSVYFFMGITLVSGIGMLDDVKSLSNRLRVGIQSLAFAILFYGLGLYVQPLWWLLLIFIIATGTLNAYNFMDGINGITGGYSMVIMVGFYVMNAYVVPFTDERFLIVMMIGLMIFNFFNFRTKAVCFAGDVGSTTIGFVITFLLLQLVMATGNYVYIGMLAVYAADSILTILHRLWRIENIFTAHRLHFFQIVVSKTGISHLTMSICFMIAQGLITTILILNAKKPQLEQYKALIIIAIVLTMLYVVVKKRLMPSAFTLKERFKK